MRNHWIPRASLAASAGLITAAALCAAPAQADTTETFLSALDGAGIPRGDAVSTEALGKSACSMLKQPAGSFAYTAARVRGQGNMSAEMSAVFTRIAVSIYCPEMLSKLTGGVPGVPSVPGLPSAPGI